MLRFDLKGHSDCPYESAFKCNQWTPRYWLSENPMQGTWGNRPRPEQACASKAGRVTYVRKLITAAP